MTGEAGGVRSGAAAWSIEGTALALGGYTWIENQLFEVFGRLASMSTASPDVRLVALAHAAHHAWHAELWRARIPILPHLAVDEVVAPAGREPEAVPDLPDPKSALVQAYQVVLPDLIDAYRRHLARARPVADGPVIRALELVLADEWRDLAEGEELLAGLARA